MISLSGIAAAKEIVKDVVTLEEYGYLQRELTTSTMNVKGYQSQRDTVVETPESIGIFLCLLFFFVNLFYRRLGGPPRVIPFAAAADCPAGLEVVPVPVLGGGLLFPGRGNLVPNCLSSLRIICGLGMAFPDSYSATTCGFSLMAVAKSFWVIFLAERACIMALLKDLSTLAIVPTSVASSNCMRQDQKMKKQLLRKSLNSKLRIKNGD